MQNSLLEQVDDLVALATTLESFKNQTIKDSDITWAHGI